MSMKNVALVASAALAASSVLLVVQPAQGALVTRCTGVAGAVTVPGDLVVARGRSCTLDGTTVLGDVRVAQGADLLAEGATVHGDLTVQDDGFADVVDSEVGGTVRGHSQYGVFLEASSVRAVDQRDPRQNGLAPFVYTLDTDVEGPLRSRAGEVLVESSVVEGDVAALDGEFADVVDSVLEGSLTVRDNARGAVVCESEIYGDAVFQGNGATLQIGGSGAVGPCDGASFWGGDVTFTDNAADDTGFDVSDNIVRGDLAGRGNDPLPTGAGNRVRGEVTLEFADPEAGTMSLQPPSELSVENQEAAEAVAQSRVAALQERIADRRTVAEKDAAATPPSRALVPGNS